MKAVAIADAHIHPFRVPSKDGGTDRLKDGLSVLRQSLDLAYEEDATWISAGDMKQPKPYWPQQALTGMHEILRDPKYRDVPKIMLAGNHDAEGIGGSGLAPFKDVATVVEQACILTPEEDVEIVFAPWNADLAEVRRLQESLTYKVPLIGHGFLAGSMLGPEDVRIAKGTAREEYGEFSMAIFGDIHKGQWLRPVFGGRPMWIAYTQALIRAGGEWQGEIFYCGSPYQQNWGERNDGKKGALVVDFDAGTARLHELQAPRFIHLELDEKALEKFIDVRNAVQFAGCFVRIIYTGKPTKALEEIRELGPKTFRSFQLIPRVAEKSTARAEIHAGMDRPQMVRKYMDARPVPEGLDKEKTYQALMRLMTNG